MGAFDGLSTTVTGGASGIGLATARLLTAQGARVAVLDLGRDSAHDGRRSRAGRHRRRRGGGGGRGAGRSRPGRSGRPGQQPGIGAQGDVEDNPDDEWHRVLDVNVVGTVRVTRAALPALRASAHASIVDVGSIAATAGLPQRALYSAGKRAVLALTRAMAADLLPEGIRVNAVSPGTTDTPWGNRLLDGSPDPSAELVALAARQPHGRLVAAGEVVGAIACLASPAVGSTTGTNLAVDGGMDGLRLRKEG
jgi:NAD(P)-dependent dehydrogenase (short-subunit alcohol dehydrogenase family)